MATLKSQTKLPGSSLRSFNVVDVSTNRKPVCDFLLVNNTNLHPLSHRFPVTAH